MRDQTSIFDITARFHRGSRTSREANNSMKAEKSRLRSMVVQYVKSQGILGATSDETEEALNLNHQTISARMTECKALGLLADSGTKRLTRSGRNAAVLIWDGIEMEPETNWWSEAVL